ncbi:MAG: YggS family pyridoxal phosphate-dependent enzyme [Bacteroidaceae bacterium]
MEKQAAQRTNEIIAALPEGVQLVAVSKYHPAKMIQEVYEGCPQRIFAESHAQELQTKHEILPKDIQWHFIGHLQRNKVKYIVPYVSLIHSVDSPRLLAEINKQALNANVRVDCLLQLHVAQEETKYGFTPEECMGYLETGEWKQMTGVRIRGMMCMASNVSDQEQIAREFEIALHTFQRIKESYFKGNDTFNIRSWGMSHDYHIAIRCGSNMVRVGTAIFGERQY